MTDATAFRLLTSSKKIRDQTAPGGAVIGEFAVYKDVPRYLILHRLAGCCGPHSRRNHSGARIQIENGLDTVGSNTGQHRIC